MFEDNRNRSFVARARRGAGRSQAQAAAEVCLARATLNNYESGRATPSERKTWELLTGLALGDAVAGERPTLLVSFALVGQRFATWRTGLLAFREIAHAQRLCDHLDLVPLERVVVVPVWPSAVGELLARHERTSGEARVVFFEDTDHGFDELVLGVLGELSEHVATWLEAGISARAVSLPIHEGDVGRAAA